MLGLPVQAQDAGSTVWFDGVGFTFDRQLGYSVNITQVPGQPPDLQSIDVPDARHTVFTLYGRRPELGKVPRVADATGEVRVYRTADLARYDLASKQLAQLRSMLADRPDLAPFMALGKEDVFGDELPFLPIPDAGQLLRARAHYVDTPEVSGIAYLLALGQDTFPMTADDFWYTFQGLSADGTRLITVLYAIKASTFPDRISDKAAERSLQDWPAYVNKSTATLNAAAPSAFSPPLTSIDALVRSITFEGFPAASPSPLGSPVPVPSAAG
jgi:hypothetical protein